MYSLSFTGLKYLVATGNRTQDCLYNAQALCHWATTATWRTNNKHSNSVFILLCYSLTLNRPTKFLFFQRFLLLVEFFSSNLLFHIIGSIPSGDQIFFNSVLFKKACERERIHLKVCYCIPNFKSCNINRQVYPHLLAFSFNPFYIMISQNNFTQSIAINLWLVLN